MSAGRPQRERLVCVATTSGGLLVAIDPARTGGVPGAVVGRLVAGEPGRDRGRVRRAAPSSEPQSSLLGRTVMTPLIGVPKLPLAS
jgi:hypothetical protein